VEFKISRQGLDSLLRIVLLGFPAGLVCAAIYLYTCNVFGLLVVIATYWLLLGLFLLCIDFNILPVILNESIKHYAPLVFTFGGRAFLQLLAGFTMVIYLHPDTVFINVLGAFGLMSAVVLIVLGRTSLHFPEPVDLKNHPKYNQLYGTVFPHAAARTTVSEPAAMTPVAIPRTV
jgi:hypothetical protein